MEIVKFRNVSELGAFVYNLATEESETVATVMFREDTLNLFATLSGYEDIGISDIEIWNDTDYYEEYYLYLTNDLLLKIEPIHKYGEIHAAESDVVLFAGNVSSKIIFENPDSIHLEIEISNDNTDDDSDGGCGNCCEDCSNCRKKEQSQVIDSALSFWEYINTYFEQR